MVQPTEANVALPWEYTRLKRERLQIRKVLEYRCELLAVCSVHTHVANEAAEIGIIVQGARKLVYLRWATQ